MGRAAVIISTYDRPGHLERSLLSLARQSEPGFEVIVADDGSGEETRETVERFRVASTFPVRHVRQDHRGFRKARILNRAVRATSAEHLLFLDQDVLAPLDWVAVHRGRLTPNRFLAGGCVYLSREDSEAMDSPAIERGVFERLRRAPRYRAAVRSWRVRRLKHVAYACLGRPRKPRVLGMNLAVARDLLEKVNGFDERYEGWGWEDVCLRTRMWRAGGRGIGIWSRSIVLHLWHPEDPTKLEPQAEENERRYDRVRRGELPWRCETGLDRGP